MKQDKQKGASTNLLYISMLSHVIKLKIFTMKDMQVQKSNNKYYSNKEIH